MLEILMGVTLAIMGIYFFKSTDLPKELTERSAQLRSQDSYSPVETKSNKSFANINVTPKVTIAPKIIIDHSAEKALINKKMNELTLTITTLEQELNVNKARNAEILRQIDMHLATLNELQNKSNQLA